VLAIDPAFTLTGGRERWLYRVARKHAGGAGADGFAISMPTLFEKSGAEGDYRRFKFEIAKIAKETGCRAIRSNLNPEAKQSPCCA
jgi:plasmid replication initiation protein